MSIKSKRLLLLAVAVALVLTLAGVFAFAANEPSAEIKLINLEYNQNVEIKYAVEVKNLPGGASVGVKLTRSISKGGEISTINSEAKFDDIIELGGKEYYVFDAADLSASEMSTYVYATPYVKIGEDSYVYGAAKKTSILEYAYKMFGKIEGGVSGSNNVKTMITRMLDYGTAVQKYSSVNLDRLANATYYQVNVSGGKLADGYTSGLYLAGESVALTADPAQVGREFLGWKKSGSDALIETDAITVGTANATYTSQYSVYQNVVKLTYQVNGGTLPAGALTEYDRSSTVPYVLPVPTRSGYVFSGWYTNSTFAQNSAISEIPAAPNQNYTLYAKWNKILSEISGADTSGLTTTLNTNNTLTTVNHPVTGKPVALWTKGDTTAASHLALSGNLTSALGSEKQMTLRLTISTTTEGAVTPSYLSLKSSNSSYDSGMGSIILRTDATGAVTLGSDTSNYITTVSQEPLTLSIVVDFEAGTVSAYNENGVHISTAPFARGGASAATDWLSTMKYYYWRWTCQQASSGSIYIHDISVYAGAYTYSISKTGYTYDELSSLVNSLLAEKNSFTDSDFDDTSLYVKSLTMDKSKWQWKEYGSGGVMRSTWGILDSTSPYALTKRTGTAAYDARLMLNNETLDSIIANMNKPEYATVLAELFAIAKLDCDGTLIDPMVSYNGYAGNHNYDPRILAIIEAKALVYRIMYEQNFADGTPEALERDMYGYQAVIAIKNYLKTLRVETYVGDDTSRYFGHVMYTAAEVYDWCKPILTESDKHQIILGVVERCCAGKTGDGSRNKLSVNYPPISDQTFTGHSSETMLLRDYFAFAVAIYDDDPTWYNYIASGILNRFVPGRIYYFQSGMTHQGVSNYVHIRHAGDLYAAWIFQAATGKNPYTGIENTMISVLGYQLSDGTGVFEDGDGNNPTIQKYAPLVLMASAICELGGFEDNADTLYTWFYELNGFDTHYRSTLYNNTYASFFIFALQGQEMNSDKYDGLDVIQYNGSPLGQMISRAEWGNPDAAATFMKIKERHTSNHEHNDAGTFQIYYKGLLTGDSGVYGSSTGSDHYTAYSTATVAHNGILVYDTTSTDALYTGGQREPGPKASGGNWEKWLNNETGNYDAGTVIGMQYGYKDAAKTKAKYAYLAGDVTSSYDTSTQVNHVERRMLTVYTDSTDFPMAFFVYDDVEAKSTSFETKFLLHVNSTSSPSIKNNTVTINNGVGKLVLTCLTDYARIDKLGGRATNTSGAYNAEKSSNYLVNGVQVYDSTLKDDGCWGRVEIVSTAKATKMVNVIYVTDVAQYNPAPAVTRITGTGVEGGTFGNIAAVFMTSRTRVTTTQSFTVSGSGNMEYYVSGVAAGTWTVSVGGTTQTVTATADGGLLVFTAPAGTVTITPAN